MMRRLDVVKTLQAISSLLHFDNTKEMSYLRLLKLLYIADRESIQETGQPITGDRVVAMEHGPVLSGTYELIKGEHSDWGIWSEFFRKVGYRLEMIKDPGNGKLSKYEITKLRDLVTRYADQKRMEHGRDHPHLPRVDQELRRQNVPRHFARRHPGSSRPHRGPRRHRAGGT